MDKRKEIIKQIVGIDSTLEELNATKEKLRIKLFSMMEKNEAIYIKEHIAEKIPKKEVDLIPKEDIFELLGENLYIKLSSIGITSLRGKLSDRKLKKIIKKERVNYQLRIRRII